MITRVPVCDMDELAGMNELALRSEGGLRC